MGIYKLCIVISANQTRDFSTEAPPQGAFYREVFQCSRNIT
jgi:hypothetical protein